VTLKSTEGFYQGTKENVKERKFFFEMMTPFFITSDGWDMIGNHHSFIPFFAFFEKYRPCTKTSNIGILSSFYLFQRPFLLSKNQNIMKNFIGFDLDIYNYLERDIYYDYLFPENEEIKEYAFRMIVKYNHLYFLLNFLISSNLTNKMDEMYYFQKYMIVIKIISSTFIPNKFLRNVMKYTSSFFNNETDIYKITAFKYAPRYLPIKNFTEFTQIFEIISPEIIKERLNNVIRNIESS
jgi:hypothetical protein